MDLFNIEGKNAIITGGNRGIGKAIVEGYLNSGANVIIIARNKETSVQVEKYKKQGHNCEVVFCDLANRKEREVAFNKALEIFNNHLDILVNVAGMQIRHPAEEFPLDDFDKVIEVNLTATYDFCQRAIKAMIKNKGGKIINFASMLSWFGGYTVSAYAASKGGVSQITKAFSNECASKGININAIAPGYMDTEMNTALINDSNRNDTITARIPQKRWGLPIDCVGPAIFLASSASDYLNGAIIPVDGGFLNR
jgi:2-deoxy-D-gluconate 3-dehydrogenase